MSPQNESDRLRRLLIILAFFVSGAAALVYEVLWTRQLTLVFGVTVYAVSTVLATFMGGLALGSWLFGRRVDRSRNPLLVYAGLEVGITVYVLIVPALLASLRPAYVVMAQMDLPYPVFAFGRAMLAAAVLLPPTTLMGATFPVLSRYWVRTRSEVGLGVGGLYFVNTAGAIAGTIVSGFFLIERFGLQGTTMLAAGANLAAAVTAFLLSRGATREVPAEHEAVEEVVDAVGARALSLVLLCVGISGFTSLSYQVLWSRALLRYLYNSTYAFTAMLATFLAGIALGSVIYTLWLRRSRRQLAVFSGLQMLVGLGFLGSAMAFPYVVDASTLVLGTENVTSFRNAVGVMFLRAAIILLPPTIFLGASVPLAMDVSARALSTLGRSVGRVYAVNTVGSILGSLAAAFLLIPWLGMQGTLLLLIALNVASAAALGLAGSSPGGARGAVVLATVVCVGMVAFGLPQNVFVKTFPPSPNLELVFYREGSTDTVGVVQGLGNRAIVYEDRRGTAGTGSYGVNYFLGHLPVLLHPGTPESVLHIAFGVGNSLSAVAAHDDVESLHNVELSPHVVEAAPFFWTNNDVLEDPRIRTIIDDGRNYLMATEEVYDVIVMEPPETFTAGVINLYTREFYRDALEQLADDGLMMQWIPTGNGPLEEEKRLLRAFSDVFPHVTAWWQLDGGCLLLVGTKQPMSIDYQRFVRRFDEPKVRRNLRMAGLADADHLLSFFQFDDATYRRFVAGSEPVDDDRTVLDFSMPRYLGSGFGLGQFSRTVHQGRMIPLSMVAQRARYYRSILQPVDSVLTNLGDEAPGTVAARIAERRMFPVSHPPISEAKWAAAQAAALDQ